MFANADGGFLWRGSWRSRTFNPGRGRDSRSDRRICSLDRISDERRAAMRVAFGASHCILACDRVRLPSIEIGHVTLKQNSA